MQKIVTWVFTCSSIAFGILGILLVLTSPGKDDHSSDLNILIMKLLMVTVFIILPSFALSVASKYLKSR